MLCLEDRLLMAGEEEGVSQVFSYWPSMVEAKQDALELLGGH